MVKIGLSEAKSQLSEYARRAERGETTLVCKHNSPSFVIAPAPETNMPVKKRLGILSGKVWIADDFDETPRDVTEAFYGNGSRDAD